MLRPRSQTRYSVLLIAAILTQLSSGSTVAQQSVNMSGSWRGDILAGGVSLTIVFNVEVAEDGSLSATMDSPDQGAMGLPVSEATFADGVLRLVSAAVGGEFEGTLTPDDTLDGEWRQGGGAYPLILERSDPVVPEPRPQDPQPPFPYHAEDVRFANAAADIELAGTLTTPDGSGPFPGVVLVSGSGAQNRDEELLNHRPFLVLADHLSRNGIAVLRYDDRGVGESGGDFASADSSDLATDAFAAVQYLVGRPEIDSSSIGIAGHSEGGLIAPMVAAHHPEVAFIVMLAGPGVTGEEILYAQGELINLAGGATEEQARKNREIQSSMFAVVRAEPDREAAAEQLRAVMRAAVEALTDEEKAQSGLAADDIDGSIEQQVAQVNSPWFRYFLTYDPRPALRRVTVPVLAINGELDLQVPFEVNLQEIAAALAEAGNEDVTIRPLPGLNHLFQPATTGAPSEYVQIETTMSPEVLDLIAAWISERFR